MIAEKICSLDSPVVFIMGSDDATVHIPEINRSALVSASRDCIAVKAQSYVDGDVRIRIAIVSSDTSIEVEPYRVFEGRLRTPSGRVVVVDSADFELASIAVDGGMVRVSLNVDDPVLPAAITCLITRMRESGEGIAGSEDIAGSGLAS